jgi:hypothetical protein
METRSGLHCSVTRAITLIRRLGSALDLNVRSHVLAFDNGVPCPRRACAPPETRIEWTLRTPAARDDGDVGGGDGRRVRLGFCAEDALPVLLCTSNGHPI